MKFWLLVGAVLAFVAAVLLPLIDGSAGDLNLIALGLAFLAGSFLADTRP